MWSWLAGAALATPLTDARVETLDNGLTVIVEARPEMGVVGLDLRFPVGAERERGGQLGLTHLVEHRMFGGSRHVPPRVDWLDVAGIRWNASTSMDTTEVWMSFHPSAMERALFLVSDHVGWLGDGDDARQQQLTSALEADIAGVLQELKERYPTPSHRAPQTLLALAAPPDHPHAHDVAGQPGDIAAATPASIRSYWLTHYGPDNAVLTLVGALDPDEALARVRHWFADVPARAPAPPPALPPITSGRDAGLAVEREGWMAAWPTPGLAHPDAPALTLMAGALRQSRPEDGALIAWNGRERLGFFLYAASGDPEAAASLAAARLEAVLSNPDGQWAAGLEPARRAAVAGIEDALARPEGRAAWLGRCYLRWGDPNCAADAVARLEAVTPEAISEAGRRHLVAARRSTLTLSPAPSAPPPEPWTGGGEPPRADVAPEPPAAAAHWPDRSAPPPLGAAEPSALPPPEVAGLPGGAQLFHARAPGAREITVTVTIAQTAEVSGAAARAWAALAGDPRLSVAVGSDATRLSLRSAPAALEEGLAALGRALGRLRSSGAALAQVVNAAEAATLGLSDPRNPGAPLATLQRGWFLDGPLRPPAAEDWAALRPGHVRRLARRLRRAPITVVSAGDLPVGVMAEAIARHLPRRRALKKPPAAEAASFPDDQSFAGLPTPGGPRARLLLALEQPPLDHPDAWTAAVLAHALEGAAQGRLGNELGLIYGLSVDVEQSGAHGLLILRTETAPETAAAAVAELEALLKRIANHGLPPALIDSARRDLVRRWERSRASDEDAARRYDCYHRGLTLDGERAGLSALSSLTREETRRVAERYLGADASRRWLIAADPTRVKGLPVAWSTN